MPAATSEDFSVCNGCTAPLPTGALVCRQCHTLVHREELEQLSEAAKALVEQGEALRAREHWVKALTLLPPQSRQAGWVQQQIQHLESAPIPKPSMHASSRWAKRLGPVAAIVLLLTKGKTLLALFNAKFLLSFGAFFSVYWSLYGWVFGLGFAAQILFHELGHYIDVKRRGLPADMPVFLPGLGAYVRWQALGVSTKTRAEVSLAGPLAGLFAAGLCAVMWERAGVDAWAALARAGAWLNLLNLIPVWALDGGQAFAALGKTQRASILFAALALLLVSGEGLLLLIALGAGWRLFTTDLPLESSGSTAFYYAALMIALGLLIHSLPGHGAGLP